MKPFRFRLQSVFDLRARALDAAKQNHALALEAVQTALQILRDAAAELDRLEQRMAAARTAAFRAHEHDLHWNAVQRQSIECDRLAEALRNARHEAEARRLEMVDARTRHETLATLESSQRRAHATELLRREAAELDDLTTASYARRSHAFAS